MTMRFFVTDAFEKPIPTTLCPTPSAIYFNKRRSARAIAPPEGRFASKYVFRKLVGLSKIDRNGKAEKSNPGKRAPLFQEIEFRKKRKRTSKSGKRRAYYFNQKSFIFLHLKRFGCTRREQHVWFRIAKFNLPYGGRRYRTPSHFSRDSLHSQLPAAHQK